MHHRALEIRSWYLLFDAALQFGRLVAYPQG
jgi:hypothetical protein